VRTSIGPATRGPRAIARPDPRHSRTHRPGTRSSSTSSGGASWMTRA